MKVKVRVRGIYATALSKILHDRSIELVDVTDVIAKRLGISELRGVPADVTIKSDDEDPSNILVIGFPESVRYVVNVLMEEIPYVIVNMPEVGLYATFKTSIVGIRDNECIIDTPYGQAPIVDVRECVNGAEVYATSIRVPLKKGERMVFSNKLRVVGYYAILGRGGKVTFSNFIKNRERVSELVMLSSNYVRKGYSIHWRSNVDDANISEVINELEALMSKLEYIEKELRRSKPLEIVYEGERVALIILSSLSKEYLDSIRARITPTTPYHHSLRSLDDNLKYLVDILDVIASKVDGVILRRCIREWIKNSLTEYEVGVRHVKPDGSVISLSSGKVINIIDDNGLCVNIERGIVSKGLYDGLGIPKEVGDKALTEVCEGRWWVIHRYLSSNGRVKGVYININTPPEIIPYNNIKYVDLGIDLLLKEGRVCKLVDTEEFRELLRNNSLKYDILIEVLKTLNILLTSFCTVEDKP